MNGTLDTEHTEELTQAMCRAGLLLTIATPDRGFLPRNMWRHPSSQPWRPALAVEGGRKHLLRTEDQVGVSGTLNKDGDPMAFFMESKMQPTIYDVADSIELYISVLDRDISQFARGGSVVEDYMARLATYAVAIMGKRTYEFGYRFGLKPGQNPYEPMKTLVFPRSLELPADSAVTACKVSDANTFRELKNSSTGPIYLSGGGAFADSLLCMGLIDRVRLKRAPVILGSGVRLFAGSSTSPRLQSIEIMQFAGGYTFQAFEVNG